MTSLPAVPAILAPLLAMVQLTVVIEAAATLFSCAVSNATSEWTRRRVPERDARIEGVRHPDPVGDDGRRPVRVVGVERPGAPQPGPAAEDVAGVARTRGPAG